MNAQLRLATLSAGGAAVAAMGVLAFGAPDVTAQPTVAPATATASATVAEVSHGGAVTTTTTSNMSFRPVVTATVQAPPT